MKIISDTILYDGRFIRTIDRGYIGRDGKKHVWEMVERKPSGRIVAIAAITPNQEIVLEKIFRIPLKTWVIELPAGMMDVPGESEEDAVQRELLEETGYAVDALTPLLSGPFDSGLAAEELSLYAGINARKVRDQTLDNAEEIEVMTVPVMGLLDMMHEARDVKFDIKTAGILPLLERAGLIR